MSSNQAIGPGQWIGELSGVNVPSGWLTISIEADRPDRCLACIQQMGPVPPWRIAFKWALDGNSLRGESCEAPLVFDQGRGTLVSHESYPEKASFPLPTPIEFIATVDGPNIEGEWVRPDGVCGRFRVTNALTLKTSQERMSWSEVKSTIQSQLSNEADDFWFRGQSSNRWRLVTSFHRLGRYDLVHFEKLAVEDLHREIGLHVKHQFDLSKPADYGELISIAQHHGFPTPLLDWTASPYIAAYFAFAGKVDQDDVRLFAFNARKWPNALGLKYITDPSPVVSTFEFGFHNNPRHLPQQSRHMLSSVADVGGFIRIVGEQNKEEYLRAIDIPASERQAALKDLRYMGITAATLFPGLDGACKALRERLFGCP